MLKLGKFSRYALPLIALMLFTACEGSYLRNRLSGKEEAKKEAGPAPVAPPIAPVAPPPPNPQPNIVSPTEPAPVAPDAPMVPTAPRAPSAPGTPSLDEKITEVNLYLKCINRTVPRTNDSYARYLTWVNEQTGPTCQERYISYGLYTLYEDGIKTCQEAAMKGAAGGPSMPKMEKSMADMAAAYAQLVPLVQSAEDYYQQEDYKDDNCAKAKAMHPQLIAAFKKFHQAYVEMQPELKAAKAEIDNAELARLESQPDKKLELLTRKFSVAARVLVETIPEDNPANFKSSAYLAAYPALDTAYNDLNTYLTANPAESDGVFWYSAFTNTAKSFFTKAKFLKRDLAEGKNLDSRPVQDVVDEYNRMIGDYNNIRFKGASPF